MTTESVLESDERRNSPISVVIPTRNRDALLAEAVASVLCADVGIPPQQIIVVDDGCSPVTEETTRSLGVRYVGGIASSGPASARNRGLAMVETEFVAFLDDDDCWTRENMGPQLRSLRADDSMAFAFGRVQRTDANLNASGAPFPPGEPPDDTVLDFVYLVDVQLGAALFRTSSLESMGGFTEGLFYGEDRDLLVRLAARSKGTFIAFTGCLYRQRKPEPRDAMKRWTSHKAYCQQQRLFARQGIPQRTTTRIRAELHFRGMTSFYFVDDAAHNLSRGDRAGALRALTYALRTSPVHTLMRHRAFWSCTRGLLWRQRPELDSG